MSGILPSYLSEDMTAKAEAYAEWDPSSAPSASAYSSSIDTYACSSHLTSSVAAEAYSQPSSEPSPTSSTATASTAPPPTTVGPLAPIIKKERPKAKYRDWNEGSIDLCNIRLNIYVLAEFQTLLEKHDQCGDDLEAATPHTLALQKLVRNWPLIFR